MCEKIATPPLVTLLCKAGASPSLCESVTVSVSGRARVHLDPRVVVRMSASVCLCVCLPALHPEHRVTDPRTETED